MGLRLVLDEDLATTTGQFFTSTPGLGQLPAVRIRLTRKHKKSCGDDPGSW